jgi:hypothetical protein
MVRWCTELCFDFTKSFKTSSNNYVDHEARLAVRSNLFFFFLQNITIMYQELNNFIKMPQLNVLQNVESIQFEKTWRTR